jgi:hypothetical protein
MKRYQQNIRPDSVPASASLPIYPQFNSGDPDFGNNPSVFISVWFDKDGKYVGWTDTETARKFLLGKLYYKTKGAYKIKTSRAYDSSRHSHDRNITIYEKSSGRPAAYAQTRVIQKHELIDMNDRSVTIPAAIEEIKKFNMNNYNFTNFPNTYEIVPSEFRNKFAKDFQEFLNMKKKELIDYCESEMKVDNTYTEGGKDVELNLNSLI